jgi:hypothetical protein
MAGFQVKRGAIIGILAVVFVGDGALAYYNVKLSAPRETREQALALQVRKMALVKADLKQAGEIRAKIPDVLKNFDQFESTLLPASNGYSVITQELGEFARDTHVIMDQLKFHEKDLKERNLTELTMESSVTGDYNAIVHLLNRLQRSKNVYILDSLDVGAETSGKGPVGLLKVNLRMRTYFRKA